MGMDSELEQKSVMTETWSMVMAVLLHEPLKLDLNVEVDQVLQQTLV